MGGDLQGCFSSSVQEMARGLRTWDVTVSTWAQGNPSIEMTFSERLLISLLSEWWEGHLTIYVGKQFLLIITLSSQTCMVKCAKTLMKVVNAYIVLQCQLVCEPDDFTLEITPWSASGLFNIFANGISLLLSALFSQLLRSHCFPHWSYKKNRIVVNLLLL